MATAQTSGGANAPDPTLLKEMLASYWRIEDQKNGLRQAHRKAVGELSEQQAQAKERAHAAGHPIGVFNALVATEKARRAAITREAKLDEDEREHLELVRKELGLLADLPLGKAALGETEEEDLRGSSQKRRETEGKSRRRREAAELDAVASNGAEKLADGIKPTSPPTSH